MSLNKNSTENIDSLFSSYSKQFNVNTQETDSLNDIVKGLNIIDTESLNTQDQTDILRRIDDYTGFFSTQQLTNIDYKKFNEHVFFDSAVNKVSYSFDRIANIPYDKDEIENIKYNNKTDGYTNFLLKKVYPKSLGFARFTGNEKIVMYDQQGKILNDSETKKIGVLNPEDNRFSIEFWLKINSENFVNNQLVFKKLNNEINDKNGFICFVSQGTNESNFYINFLIYINNEYTSSKCLVELDKWNNINISVSSLLGNKKLNFLIDGNIVEESDIINSQNFLQNTSFGENFKNINLPLVIGGVFIINSNDMSVSSNLTLDINNENITFNNLNGDIDEFRLFHKIRSNKKIKKEMHKNIYAQEGLKLYLRLNEPGGDYQNSCLVIDYSGNKLHGIAYVHDTVNNTHSILKDTSDFKVSSDTPLNLERLEYSPVLNSSYTDIITFRSKLIEKAKLYDDENPNLIFNLMPRHYFLNSSDFQNLPVFSNDDLYELPQSITNEDGTLSDKGTKLSPVIPANNEIVNIVLIWARFFDQLKAYISSITNFLNVDYDSINNNKIIGMQIPLLCKMYGIKFKELIPSATKEKLNNENLNYEDIISEFSLRKIQNILWQRFLINTQDFFRSKGTIRSIESTFNSFGIDYSKFVDIKEYSSHNTIEKENNFKFLKYKKYLINFGNSKDLMNDPTYIDSTINDYSQNKLFLKIDNIKTQILKNKNITSSYTNGLSLNWSIELFFNFKEILSKRDIDNFYYKDKQCIFRIETDNSPTMIVTFIKNNSYYSDNGVIKIEIQPIKNNSSHNATITIDNVNIFDSPKYFLISQVVDLENNKIQYKALIDDIGKQVTIKDSRKVEYVSDEIVIKDVFNVITNDITSIINVNDIEDMPYNLSFYKNNVSISIGSYNYTNNNYLSAILQSNDDTNFQGEILKVRMWNKTLSEEEISSHSKNIENIGIDNFTPYQNLISDFEVKNINNNQITEGSDTFLKWTIEDISNNILPSVDQLGNIIIDQNTKKQQYESLNICNLLTRNIEHSDDKCIDFIEILNNVRNAKIDESNNNNKVNIISYSDENNKKLAKNFNVFPSNSMPVHFNYDETSRISIEMSIAKIINDDISKIISSLNDFNSKISNYQSLYDYSYKEIENIRDSYFDKFSDKNLINYSSIGNIFKYFDNIMSSILYDIIPSNIRFEGFNYVYESHILERHKYQYKNYNSRTSIIDINNIYNYSRENVLSRRDIRYNTNRKVN